MATTWPKSTQSGASITFSLETSATSTCTAMTSGKPGLPIDRPIPTLADAFGSGNSEVSAHSAKPAAKSTVRAAARFMIRQHAPERCAMVESAHVAVAG